MALDLLYYTQPGCLIDGQAARDRYVISGPTMIIYGRTTLITLEALPGKRRLAMLRDVIARLLAWTPQQRLPDLDGSALRRVYGRLEYARDRHGMTHLYAEREADLYTALGYLQAQERFVVIDLLRHLGAARLSEVIGDLSLGQSGKQRLGLASILALDTFIRPLDFAAEARRDFRRLSLRAQKNLEAFSAGVNDALVAWQGVYPPEYLLLGRVEPWQPEDCLVCARTGAFLLSLPTLETELTLESIRRTAGDELARLLYPEAPWQQCPSRGAPAAHAMDGHIPSFPVPLGSNAWAVAGALSRSGAPLLANDPHVPLVPAPSYWQLVHMECPEYRVQGGMFPGFPGLGFGHNGAIAWGISAAFRDAWDLYAISRMTEDAGHYSGANDQREPLHKRSAVLRTRWGRERLIEWERCIHGIVRPQWREDDGSEWALQYVDADLASFMEGYLALFAAQTPTDTEAALSQLNEGPFDFNFVYAHKDGHIAWEYLGKLPRRTGDGVFVRCAQDDDAGWQGYLDFDDNPRLRNPDCGWVVTANSTTDPRQCERIGSAVHLEPAHRQRRIATLLQARAEHDWQSMADIQADLQADYLLPAVARVCEALRRFPNQSGVLAAGLHCLGTWDGQFRLDSTGAAVFHCVRTALAGRVWPALLPAAVAQRFAHSIRAMPRLERWLADPDDPMHEYLQRVTGDSLDRWIQTSFESAMAVLVKHVGADPQGWRWDRLQYVRLGSLFAELPGVGHRWQILTAPYPGDLHTVSATVSLPDGARLRTFAGASSRFICDLGEPDAAWFAQSTGPSADPSSIWFQANSTDWLGFRYFKSALWPADRIPDVLERVIIIPTEFP